MANAKTTEKVQTLSVYGKLLKAREMFLASGVSKSGLNMHAEFKYFELEDIVPTATRIFSELGCIFITSFPENKAVGTFINLDDVSQTITVEFEKRSIAEPAKFRMNEVQGLGAEITYMRRYLYMLLFDIVETDGFDSGEIPAPKAENKKPATPQQREEIKETLTDAEGNADEMQLKALKAACKKLMDTDPEQENTVQQIAVKTEGFTKISKTDCTTLITKISEMLENYSDYEEV